MRMIFTSSKARLSISRLSWISSIFSIASTIGRRSSSVKVCRESFRISYTLVGLNSLESLGARTFTNSLMNCSYCSSLRKPKIYWLTCFLYSDGLSVKKLSSPSSAFISRLSRGILLDPTSLYSHRSYPTLRPSRSTKPQKSIGFPRLAFCPIPMVRYSPESSFQNSRNR